MSISSPLTNNLSPEVAPVPDLSRLRKSFPICSERVYLSSHCMGPLPQAAFEDFEEYKKTLSLRSRAIEPWLVRLEEIRGLIEQVLGAPSGSVALGPNATTCQAQLASSLGLRDGRDTILNTTLDFRSSRYLWSAQIRRGFRVVTIRSKDGISMPTEDLLSALDRRVAVVAVSVASYMNGAMLPIARVVEAAHAAGAIVVLDAYQAVGVVPINVTELKVDALVAGTHKWLCGGGVGLGFLYVRPELAERLVPAYPGWLGHKQAASYLELFTPAPGARRFEQGTPAMEPVYTARAGLRFLLEVSVKAVRERNLALSERIISGAEARGIPLLTPRAPEERSGMFCLGIDDPSSVVSALDARGIDVDTRPGTGIRVSPHLLNTEEECDLFLEEVSTLSQNLRK